MGCGSSTQASNDNKLAIHNEAPVPQYVLCGRAAGSIIRTNLLKAKNKLFFIYSLFILYIKRVFFQSFNAR